MKKGVYLKKGSAGQGTGAQYDELISVMTPLLAENGIVITAEKSGESRSRANAKGNYIFESDFTIHYINMDNVETGDNEESRADQKDINTINDEQQATLYQLMVDQNTGQLNNKAQKVAAAFKFQQIANIKTSKYAAILKAVS